MPKENGLFGLLDDAEFVATEHGSNRMVSATVGYATLNIANVPARAVPGDAEAWATKIAELLALEHAAVLAGYKGVADRLAHAELCWPVALEAGRFAVKPDDDGLRSLRRECSTFLDAQGPNPPRSI